MRKISRRSFLSAAAVCGAAAALTACGGSSSSTAASSTASSAAASSAAADGQKYTVGICQLVEHAALDAATQGFEDALTAQFGENVTFDFQNAQNDSATCATIANGFVSAGVDLIMANATPALQAAQAATDSIPILGTSVTEYGVALGLTDFDGTVGGNVSGTSDLAPLDQQADMITEWLPEATKVGLLYCSAEANSQYQVDEVQKYLEAKGVTATQYAFSDSNDLASVCQKAADENDAVYVPTDNTCAANTGIIDGICRPAKKPVFAGEEGICSGCGVATLSIADGLVVLLGHVGVLNGHGGDIGLTSQDLGSHLTGGVAQIVVADGQGRHAAAGADALLTGEHGLLGRAADAVDDAGVGSTGVVGGDIHCIVFVGSLLADRSQIVGIRESVLGGGNALGLKVLLDLVHLILAVCLGRAVEQAHLGGLGQPLGDRCV